MLKAFSNKFSGFFRTKIKKDVDSVDRIENAPASVQEGQLAVDICHDDEEILVIAPLAGVSLDEVTITVDDDVLTIKGERSAPDFGDDADYYVQECFWGSFSRSIILPVTADPEKVAATFDNGILIIRIPKDHQPKKRVVKIKSL